MDENIIRQWYQLFKDNHELVEIRILDPSTRKSYSGYFTDIDTILREIKQYDKCAIYFTLNQIEDACYSREQHDRISTKVKSTTSDNEIVSRKWCLIDIDCEKPSDTNSSDEEKELAKQVVNNVFKYLRNEGFSTPVICDSANGFHLLYKQDMPSNAENTETMKKFLQVLDMYFSTDKVKIDCSTFNPSRICKLYGTYSRKGSDTKERPQRLSSILKVPNEVKITPLELFQKIASNLPETEYNNRGFNYDSGRTFSNNEVFDLDTFLREHNIEVSKVVETQSYVKYILATCPFNSSHTAPDSAVFKMRDGSYGFKCLHNSCSQYSFKDFRLHYDPHAYDRKDNLKNSDRQYEYNNRGRGNGKQQRKYEVKEQNAELGDKWLSLSKVKKLDLSQLEKVKTGFYELDNRIMGLYMTEVTVLSGSNSSGKSSWINTLIMNIVQQNYKVALWSGELRADILKTWIQMVAAGKNNLKPSKYDVGKYYVPDIIGQRIDDWLEDKFFLYNNEYGTKWEQIFNDMTELLKLGIKIFILDNLFSLDIDLFDGDKNNKQKELIIQIKEFAKKNQVHIILVAHPRKVMTFLRKNDISGTSDITNAVDNVFIIHRVNNDFIKAITEFLGSKKTVDFLNFGNILAVEKNRMYGICDVFIGMQYESESRRFKNTLEETIHYGWETDNNITEIESNGSQTDRYGFNYNETIPISGEDMPIF